MQRAPRYKGERSIFTDVRQTQKCEPFSPFFASPPLPLFGRFPTVKITNPSICHNFIRLSEIINLSYDFQQCIAFPSKTTNVPSLLKFMSHFCANCNTQKSQTDKTHNYNNNNYYYYYYSYYYSTTTTTTTTTTTYN